MLEKMRDKMQDKLDRMPITASPCEALIYLH